MLQSLFTASTSKMEALIKGEPMEYDDNSFSELTSQLATHQANHHHNNIQQSSAFVDSQAEQFYLNNIQNVLNGKCDDDYEFLIDLIKMNKTCTATTNLATTTNLITNGNSCNQASNNTNLEDFNDDDDDQFTDELINPKYLRQSEKLNNDNHKPLTSSLKNTVFSAHVTSPNTSTTRNEVATTPIAATADLMSSEFFFPNEVENECFSNFSNPELSGQDLDLFTSELSVLNNHRPLTETNILLNKPTKLADYIQFNNLNLTKSQTEKELHSRLWFTCRRDFETIIVGDMATGDDLEWGSLLRCSQMLLAQGLIQHFFRTEWTLYKKFRLNEYNLYKEIISLFNDR